MSDAATSTIIVMCCPQCGHPAQIKAKRCDYCESEFIVTKLASLANLDNAGIQKYIAAYQKQIGEEPGNAEVQIAMGICRLDLGLHEIASRHFVKALEIQPDHADAHYYQALALIKSRRPRSLSMKDVEEIERYLSAAIQLDGGKAVYHYLRLVIKHEYFLKNGLRVRPPDIEEVLESASACPYDGEEVAQMLKRVPVSDEQLLQVLAA